LSFVNLKLFRSGDSDQVSEWWWPSVNSDLRSTHPNPSQSFTGQRLARCIEQKLEWDKDRENRQEERVL